MLWPLLVLVGLLLASIPYWVHLLWWDGLKDCAEWRRPSREAWWGALGVVVFPLGWMLGVLMLAGIDWTRWVDGEAA